MASSSAPEKFKPRREPRQARATRTIEALLDAAGQVLEQHGLDGFSTDRVASTAGMAVGSLYQYFPDKYQLLLALTERWYERTREMSTPEDLDRDDQIDRLAEIYREEPGSAALFEAINAVPKLAEYNRIYMEREIETVATQLAAGRSPSRKELAAARVRVNAVNATLIDATRRKAQEARDMIEILKVWLSSL